MKNNQTKETRKFRPYTNSDLPVMRDIHASNHVSQGGALFGKLHDDPNYFVVEQDHRIIAYANILETLPEKVLCSRCADPVRPTGIYVKQVAVALPFQSHGIGSFLYQNLFKNYPSRPIYAHVHASNRTSALFHLKNGFTPCGVFYAEKYYGQDHYLCFLFVREAGHGQKT